MTEVHTLDVPGARLHYEVRGSGPVLVVVGQPMSAAHLASLAEALAAHHTVVTTDPRGIANSPLEDPELDVPVDQRADDVVAILDDLGAGTADLFGSSGGAVTGLSLVTRHPDRLRTLVAHEPPLLELLPDREAQRAATDDIVATFHAEGPGPAFGKFMAHAGFVGGDEGAPAGPPPGPPPSEQDMRDAARFLAHDLLVTTRYVPDVEALRAAPTRIVIGVGEASGHLLTHRTSTALAEELGVAPTFFPGDHGGFLDDPAGFAEVLTKVLAG
ncbi:alpha/beta hydrolase [Pseudonocardia yuanmonensis]|uniref:Alpha/beta hydrolase n=1 Tax=Pseudonocardia yuanmonensis TaxID=1095914 RepID=A0ABP8XCH0_9PSEU